MSDSSARLHEWWVQDTLYLPLRPLCTNDFLTGVYRLDRQKALQRKYIEANPLAVSDLLVVDIDHEEARTMALWEHAGYMPNVIVENPENGHAHAVWALASPFARTQYAQRKPLAFAAAVTEGLRRSCGGDAAYSGLMTKNPLHEAWESELVTEHLYSLEELGEKLTERGEMPSKSWKRSKRRNTSGLGRNCCLFETARTWAYREVRNHWGDSEGLRQAILAQCRQINFEEFSSSPLPDSEVIQIAKSIHKWIVTKSRMWRDGPVVYEARFITIQSARGRKGGEAKKHRHQELEMKMQEIARESESWQ